MTAVTKNGKTKYIYLAVRADGFIKVGHSFNPLSRMVNLSDAKAGDSNSPTIAVAGLSEKEFLAKRKVELVRTAVGGRTEEAQIHMALSAFKADGCREWFHDVPESRRIVGELFDSFGPDMRETEQRLKACNVRLPRDLVIAVRVEAAELGKSFQFIVEQSIREHFARLVQCEI